MQWISELKGNETCEVITNIVVCEITFINYLEFRIINLDLDKNQ